MSGVLFIVCIPRAEHEKLFQKSSKPLSTLEKVHENSKNVQGCKSTEHVSDATTALDNLSKCKSELSLSKAGDNLLAKEVKTREVKCRDEIDCYDDPKRLFDSLTPLEKILNELLERLHVNNAVWCLGKEKKYYQVFFSIESGQLCEEALQLLASFGIGAKYNSVVSVIPCALYFRAETSREFDPTDSDSLPRQPVSAWSKFIASVRSRTTLAQLLQDVTADASLTFDWLFLLLVAAFVAAIGLVEDSTVFLVASMLISPLMGPIMACAVGTAVRDTSLQLMGLLHELFGLFLALVIGFLFGLVICLMGDSYSDQSWPTIEMRSRCEGRSLWVGVLVALPSAAAVALSVLGGYIPSLVGVAISASLLPPAVNAGLLWAKALTVIVYPDGGNTWDLNNATYYSNNTSVEVAAHGAVSLCLTIVNILCIYVGGVIVYKIKEVAPIEPKNMRFWKSKKSEMRRREEDDPSPRGSVSSLGPSVTTWDYMSWCRGSEGMQRLGGSDGGRYHDTWSPYTTRKNAPPLIKDIEGYWKQYIPNAIAKAHLGKFTSNATEILSSPRYNRLRSNHSPPSVGVDPRCDCSPTSAMDSGPSCSNDLEHLIKNGPSVAKRKIKGGKKQNKAKFTVVPSFIEPVKNDEWKV